GGGGGGGGGGEGGGGGWWGVFRRGRPRSTPSASGRPDRRARRPNPIRPAYQSVGYLLKPYLFFLCNKPSLTLGTGTCSAVARTSTTLAPPGSSPTWRS